ncbi:MAG: helix-turn-helix transcriptional regulator [Actinobacteria bacterium]|nr:helix-turn-helix transcriptional regulator [Actinomycetota bacterium]
MFHKNENVRIAALQGKAKAFPTPDMSGKASSLIIVGATIFFWLSIAAVLLVRCYNVDIVVAVTLLLIPLLSTACIAFFLGKFRSASFVVSIDAAEMAQICQPSESSTKHQVTIGLTMGDAPIEADIRAAEELGLKQRAETMKGRYGLSERETEVLLMLAKGRDANYVSDTLYISPSTAKCHIYNIYQKTDVHSRRALIDLFEDSLLAG